jgi:hypothetical protein
MYGTNTTFDTLRANYQTVADFGEDRAYDAVAAMLEAHNEIMATLYDDLLDRTTDRLRRYGTTDLMTMTKTDEMGRPPAQKIAPGAVAGFPLESFQGTWQGTRKYFEVVTVSELMGQVKAMQDADVQRLILEVQRAVFVPTNYTFDDYLVDHINNLPLPVKAFLNADSLGIPPGPNGETFDGTTHTHYLATASLVTANLVAALETVLEHYAAGQALIYINRGSETTIRAMTPNFVALQNMGIVGATTANQFAGVGTLKTVPIYNRLIGEFNGAEVWVKPWIPAGYIFIFLRNQPKPLVLRTRTATSGTLTLEARDERCPLRAETYEREFGVGVWNRTNGAILYTGGGTYTAPALAA